MDHAHRTHVVDVDDDVPVVRLVLDERLDDVDACDARDDVDRSAGFLLDAVDERIDGLGLHQVEGYELRLAASVADLGHRRFAGVHVDVAAINDRARL
jgi:hypothetical protein